MVQVTLRVRKSLHLNLAMVFDSHLVGIEQHDDTKMEQYDAARIEQLDDSRSR